ncbi:ribonucleases P/MRP protein subunit POP1-domain-containing protein [Xylariales sp. PMI_506]|nr:ribonucleases P/MRP protein subunit POP1-domain-containing protein [Xylariales sp. PMI_506]
MGKLSNLAKNGRSGNGVQAGGRDPKRLKAHEIRSIAAQSSDAALKDGELDVQAFLNARGFEIKALDESMRRTQTSKTSRAFQKVPFVMRRRAAAHNHKRVPKRLHKRARKEMEIDNTPTVNSKTRKPKTTRSRLRAETALRLGKLAEKKRRKALLKKGNDGKLDEQTIVTRMARPKLRRNTLNSPVVIEKKFRKRQIHKTWLPTHLWHTKRARMTDPKEPMWRFALPITPNQKCYRPAHRAYWEKGALAWDMSYMSTISLSGADKSIEHILRALGLDAERLWNEKGERWRDGAVHWSGNLSRKVNGSKKTIGPATVLWNPQLDPIPSDGGQKGVFKRLMIRTHPSIFFETFDELLRLAKGLTPRPCIEDLRYEIGSIDITGPSATEALLGVVKPYRSTGEANNPHVKKFEALAGLGGPSALPSGSLLAFSIMDPRLQYPPRAIKLPSSTDPTAHSSLMDLVASWHKDDQKMPYSLFDRDARFKASCLPSQKTINRRKSKKGPGALLEPIETDPEIPIILLASRTSNNTGTWTLMMPWKCISPSWYALMHYPLSSGGNPGFGGLNEIRQLAFEQSTPWFPGDHPATAAGMKWELDQRQARRKAWDRMPKGKRVNYQTIDLGFGRKGEVGEGWNCDYEGLLGLGVSDFPKGSVDVEMLEPNEDGKNTAQTTQSKLTTPSKHPLTQLVHLSKHAIKSYLVPNAVPPPPSSLATVKIVFLGRGVPDTGARIYRLPASASVSVSSQAEVRATDRSRTPYLPGGLPKNLREQWLASIPDTRGKTAAQPAKGGLKHNTSASINLEMRKRLLAQELTASPEDPTDSAIGGGLNGHLPCPDADDLVGFVTSGSFNLRAGRPEAIGCVSVDKVMEELKRAGGKADKGSRVCVVRNSGQSVGWIARWELV